MCKQFPTCHKILSECCTFFAMIKCRHNLLIDIQYFTSFATFLLDRSIWIIQKMLEISFYNHRYFCFFQSCVEQRWLQNDPRVSFRADQVLPAERRHLQRRSADHQFHSHRQTRRSVNLLSLRLLASMVLLSIFFHQLILNYLKNSNW